MHRYLAVVPPDENAAAVPGNELTDADHRVRAIWRVAQNVPHIGPLVPFEPNVRFAEVEQKADRISQSA